MKKRAFAAELVAVGITLVGLVCVTAVPFAYESGVVRARAPQDARVITLTAVGASGVWTDEDVNGLNYWRERFQRARLQLRAGEPVLLRLKSADVTHGFYMPELNVGPLEVAPGHVVEVLVTGREEGRFAFYCTRTTVCGPGHFRMRGELVVGGSSEAGLHADEAGTSDVGEYWRLPPPVPGASRAERGRWLFRQKGCFTCHGREGRGGVRNWNALDDETVPALDELADRMFLFDPEDVRTIVAQLERGTSLDELEDAEPVPRFSAVLAQFHSVQDVIKAGSTPGEKDPKLPPPPLAMPAWGDHLSDDEIDAIIAYLLALRSEP